MYYRGNVLQRMENKFGRFAIRNLMTIIVSAMGVIFLSAFLLPINTIGLFAFDTAAIMQGEVWRIITFIFIPPNANILFIIFALFFYWMIGSTLENAWGTFKFNVFYLSGMIGTIIAGLIVGFATNFYINLSLFLAFAILYPDFRIMLFLIIPVKMKWLAYAASAYLLYMLIVNSWSGRVVLLVSVLNIFLFFGRDFADLIKRAYRKEKWKRKWK